MLHFERSLQIDAPPEAVWAVLGRFMHIDEFAPEVTSVDALTQSADSVGSQRRCHFKNGNSVVEEVITWNPNKGYRVRMSEMGAMPLHAAESEISIEPTGTGGSNVVWSMDYQMKYGPLGWLLGKTMLPMMMGKILDGNLKGLADRVK